MSQVENPWDSEQSAAIEIAAKHAPIDYGQILGQNKLLMIGFSAMNRAAALRFLAGQTQIEALIDAGITNAVLQSPESYAEAFAKANQGLISINDLVSVLDEDNHAYSIAIRHLFDAGMDLKPLDLKPPGLHLVTHARFQSLTHTTNQLVSPPTEERKTVVILPSGYMKRSDSGKETVRDLYEGTLGRVSVVQLFGGADRSPNRVIQAVKEAGLRNAAFMLDMTPYQGLPISTIPYRPFNVDALIHMPQKEARDSRVKAFHE